MGIPTKTAEQRESYLEYTVNFSKRFSGRIWSKERADMTIATVGTIYKVLDVVVNGRQVLEEYAKGVTCEVRLSRDEFEMLQMAIAHMPSVSANITIKLTREPVFNYLTVGGEETPSLLFYGELEGDPEEGVANIQGLAFESQEEVNDFLKKARAKAQAKAEAARQERLAQREMGAAKAPLTEEELV